MEIIEIARVNIAGLKNRMAIAREFAKCDCFKWCHMSDIIASMRCYERDGLLVITDTEAILYHNLA